MLTNQSIAFNELMPNWCTRLNKPSSSSPPTSAILPLPVMASSNKGKEVESSARLRKRQHQGSSHAGSLTSENTQNDEHLAEVYQSPVSGFI